MPQATSISKPRFHGKLSRTMLSLIIPIVLIPTLIVGSIAYFGVRDLLKSQSFAQLSTIERNLENQINSWLGEKHVLLHNVARDSEFSSSIEKFLTLEKEDPEFSSTGEAILAELNQANEQRLTPVFDFFVIIDPYGEILAAPISNWVGEVINDEQFFASLSEGTAQSKITFRLHPFQASDTIIITALPILDENASLSGAIVAITRDEDLREFLQTSKIYPGFTSAPIFY